MIVAITTNGGMQEDFRRLGYCVDFLDNGFCQDGIDVQKFIKKVNAKRPKFAILPDNDENGMWECISKNQVDELQWIFPLHAKNQLDLVDQLGNEVIIGFPHRRIWRKEICRDYSLRWFLLQNFERSWYMGYWDSRSIMRVRSFFGMDTTMPIMLAVKKHKRWKRPGYHPKAPWGKDRSTLVLENMQTFADYLKCKHLFG